MKTPPPQEAGGVWGVIWDCENFTEYLKKLGSRKLELLNEL